MNEGDSEFFTNLRQELEKELTEGILPYWINNTVDTIKGGFYGRINFQNEPIKNAEKGIILTSRILWTFSAAFKQFRNQRYKKIAQHAYQYLIDKLWDHEYQGVYWMVDSDGNPTETRKHVYAQAFTIYALAEYYGAFGEHAALELAEELYFKIEEECLDPVNGGYFEAYDRQWNLLDDVRLSDKDRNEPKSMNTHLHLLEAYTNLYRYWPDSNLKKRLHALVDIFLNHIIDHKKKSLITFFGEDWSPRSDEISFGHNIESAWLLLEAADTLGDYPEHELLLRTCLDITKQVQKNGLDNDGGIFNEANEKGLVDDDKDWWPQAEAIVGFINAYEYTGDVQYLNSTEMVWQFIKKYIIDHKHGEWHEKVNRAGTPYELDKVRSWKCPYHNGRLALEGIKRTEKILQQEFNNNQNKNAFSES